jgi:PAS domain-containing protein
MLLAEETDEARQRTLQYQICSAQRELASLYATSSGLRVSGRPSVNKDRCAISTFQRRFEASRRPYLILDPGPGLHIVDLNDSYARATMTSRSGVAGDRLFNVYPDNPNDLYADGLSKVYASLQTAAETGRSHDMSVQRYDIRDAQGKFVERYWYVVNTPLFDQEGHLIYLMIHAEDVTTEFRREQTSC